MRRVVGAWAALVAMLVVLFAPAASPGGTAYAVGEAAAQPSIYLGAVVAPWPDISQLDRFERAAGKHMAIVGWGQSWSQDGAYQPFQKSYFQAIRDRGSLPLLDWGSWDWAGDEHDQPNFSLASITAGAHDAYLTQWAQDAKAWGKPFFLRFDAEMNGWWYPWSEQNNGNQPGDFVQAWQHVHDVFTSVGATNVTWVWCPNIVNKFSTPMTGLYPGDDYVDWTCMDGYNWGLDRNNAWQTFTEVFAGNPSYGVFNTYQQLQDVAPSKPIMIGETASSERGGEKAAWITDAFTNELPGAFPLVKALIWFNWDSGDSSLSWDIASSPAAQAAFRSAVASPLYATNTYPALASSPIPPPDSQ